MRLCSYGSFPATFANAEAVSIVVHLYFEPFVFSRCMKGDFLWNFSSLAKRQKRRDNCRRNSTSPKCKQLFEPRFSGFRSQFSRHFLFGCNFCAGENS